MKFETGVKPSVKICIFLVACALVFASPAAFSQLLLDSAVGNLGGGANELNSARGAVPESVILNNLQHQGYSNINLTPPPEPGKPVTGTATAPGGMPVKLTIDPVTGQLVGTTPID